MNALEEKLLERQAGFEEGEATGLKAGEENSSLSAIVNLMKNKGWSREEAMDALEIPEEKRERYLQKLASMD